MIAHRSRHVLLDVDIPAEEIPVSLSKVPFYWKAVLAFVAPGAVIIGASVQDSSAGESTITQSEWITAAVACVVTSASVALKANRQLPPEA